MTKELTLSHNPNRSYADPLSWFVSREEYQGEVPSSFEPSGYSRVKYRFLPFEDFLDYIRTFHFRPDGNEPILMVWCGGDNRVGMIYQHFVPKGIVGNMIYRTLGSDQGHHFLTYDPEVRRHKHEKHITCVAWLAV